MKKVISIIIPLILLLANTVFAQTFSASVNKNSVKVGETFQISFTVENGNMSNFQPPSFQDFNLMGGPNQSNSMQYVNGKMTRSVAYSYYLQAKKEGTFTIGPAQANISGKNLKSNPIEISVGKGAKGAGKSIEEQILDNVFLRVIVSDDEIYQGEQVTVTYKLYIKMDISNITIKKPPSHNGFWTQEIQLPNDNAFKGEVYRGTQYRSIVVKKYALFPQRSGELELDPMEMEAYARIQVQSQRRGFFDDFWGSYKDVPFAFKNTPQTITVKPLPEGKPPSFSGLSGVFDMKVSLDKTETETDDPITLKLKISGKGNLKMLEAPKPSLPRDIEVFDPKLKEHISKSANTVSGYKEYDYLLIPRRPGTFKIPEMKFSYFNTKEEKYVELSSDEFEIKVTGEASTGTSHIANVSKEDVELLGEDIRYIKSGTELRKKDAFFISSFTFGFLFLMPFILFALLVFYKKRKNKLANNSSLLKRKRAGKEAGKRLAKAKKILDSGGDNREFYKSVSEALWGYISDSLNIPASELTREKVEIELERAKLDSALKNEFFAALDKCEMALFAPSSAADKNAMYDKASRIIEKIGGVLKS